MTAMHLRTYLTGVGLVFWSLVAHSYKEEAHQTLTQAAVSRSVLQLNPAVLQDLGLKPNSEFPNSNNDSKTIPQLLMDGADFEDSSALTIRVLRHFYNPVTGQGLNGSSFPTQKSSPDWALARPGTDFDQKNSYGDARQYLFDALTAATKENRDTAFGRMFQTLGHVVHHLQDMAQPQHVRNDVHCDSQLCRVIPGAYSPSRYEEWTNGDVVRNNLPTNPPAGYDITSSAFTNTFKNPRSFWHTLPPPGPGSAPIGKGIAEFTNRNFVSHGTNFDKPSMFVSPLHIDNISYATPQQLCLNANPSCPPGFSGRTERMTFFANTVQDSYLGSSAGENPRMNTYSIFDQDLIARGGAPRFALNRFNFQAAHDFLIPRAVAYSAGMINYFFRGKIDLVPDDTNPGTHLIKNLGSEPMTGDFRLYYDYDDANAGTVNNRTLLIERLNISIPANGQVNIGTIPVPTNPAPKTPGEYMLVFDGDMGQETRAQFGIGAVAGKVVSSPFLIFAAHRDDALNSPGSNETRITVNFVVPESYAQRFRSNPAAVAVQFGGLTLPLTSVDNGCLDFGCVRIRGKIPLVAEWDLIVAENNAFVVRSATFPGSPIFFGNAPEDLRLISPDILCANHINSSWLALEGYAQLSFVPVKLFFEGEVLFEFVVSPPCSGFLCGLVKRQERPSE